MKKNIIWVIIAGAAAYFFLKGRQVQNFLNVIKFEIRQVTVKKLNIVVKMAILNPTNTTLHINSFAGSLVFDNKEIAHVKNFVPITVQPNGETEFYITLIPQGFGIVEVIKDVVSKKLSSYGLRLIGIANINGLQAEINVKA